MAERADPEQIQALLIEVARGDPRVREEPEPEALIVRFTEDSAEFQLRFWTEDAHWLRLRSDVRRAAHVLVR